jgi:hypothetical protein
VEREAAEVGGSRSRRLLAASPVDLDGLQSVPVERHTCQGHLQPNDMKGSLCRTGLLGVAALAGLGFAAVLIAVTIRNRPDPFTEAARLAQNSRAVRQRIGEPIHIGSGVELQMMTGSTEFSIPLSGPKGRGILRARVTESPWRWAFSELTFEAEGTGDRMSLLHGH